SFLLCRRAPPRSPPFPYTTLFRSEGCYVALQGDEARAFYSQAQQYKLPQRVQFYTEIVAQADIKVLGKDAIGLMGSSRYPITYEDRKSTRLNSSHRTISYAVFCLK